MDAESLGRTLRPDCLAIHLKGGDELACAFEIFSGKLANGLLVERLKFVCAAISKQESCELRIGVAGDLAWPEQLLPSNAASAAWISVSCASCDSPPPRTAWPNVTVPRSADNWACHWAI